MCSQSGNYQDLVTAPGHSPSCVLEPDVEPDSSTRQEHSVSSLPSDMGLGYLRNPVTDDVRSNYGTISPPVYEIQPTINHEHNGSSSSSLSSYLPYSTNILYPSGSLSASSYTSSGTSYYSPSSSIYSMPDIKPRLNSYHTSPGMAPPSRSSALPQPHPSSPINTIREIYGGQNPHHLRRTSDIRRSPSTSVLGRGAPLSPTSSSGFTSPTMGDSSQASPPLHATEVIHQIQTSDGQVIRPEIFGKIDKGFFMADNDWTCYRRNYFSLNCSYTLHPAIPSSNMHLVQPNGSTPQIYSFAISIAAVVDNRDGKAIELVQHTPKRDKGPQEKPGRMTLAPRPPPTHGMYGGDSGSGRGLYDQNFGAPQGQPAMEATFERIQFKNATANNGKRRAAQQYYHLLVELFADVGPQHPDRYIKVATRMSAPMVVRGRSPGHYQSERRGSNASAGGSGGAGGAGSYTPNGSASRTPGDISMSGGSSMLPSTGYGNSYDSRSQHYRAPIPPLQIPMEPTLSAEEAKSIEEAPCYMYYPGAIYEGHEARFQLPSVTDYNTAKLKQEFTSPAGYVLPSLASTQDFGRHCGRWEGTAESKGYFPTALIQQELNIT